MKNAVTTLGVLLVVLSASPACAEEAADNTVLVSNARAAVTRAEFDAEIAQRIPPENRIEFLASRERIANVLEELLLVKTEAAEAREIGLDKLPSVSIRMKMAQERILAVERIKHLEQEVKLPDFNLRAREIYLLNPEKYTGENTVRASHILIDLNGRSREDALKRVEEVRALIAGGSDFGELAAQYSDDPGSKDNKGDLGYFAAGQMVRPFSEAAFAMKKGEISAPVETKFGFHIIQLVDTKPGVKQEFDAVKAQIIEELKTRFISDYKVNYHTGIRTDKDMKINEEDIMKIKTQLPYVSPSAVLQPAKEVGAAQPEAKD